MQYKSFIGPNQMSDGELLEVAASMHYYSENNKIVPSGKISLRESFDAFPCYIGINESGKVFLETKKYGPLTLQELDKTLLEDDMYENVFYSLISITESGHISRKLKEIYESGQPWKGPVKFKVSLFPALTHKPTKWGGDYVFNVCDYHKEKMGKDGAVVVEGVEIFKEGRWGRPIRKPKEIKESFLTRIGRDLWEEDGDDTSVEESLLESFSECDSSEWRVYSPSFMNLNEEIQLNHKFDTLKEKMGLGEDSDIVECLSVAKFALKEKVHPHREWVKEKFLPHLRETFNKLITQIAESAHSKLGKDFSEKVYPVPKVVLEVRTPDAKSYKVYSESTHYKLLKEDRLRYLNETENINNTLKESILKEAYSINDATQIGRVIQETSKNYRNPSHHSESRKRKFMERVFSNLASQSNESLVREKVGLILEKTLTNIEVFKEEWQEQKERYNPSICRKVENKLAKMCGGIYEYADGTTKEIHLGESKLGGLIKAHKMQESVKCGFDYVSSMFESLLNEDFEPYRKVYETAFDDEGNVIPAISEREEVALVYGNFQPWTRSHHQMLESVKEKLEEIGGSRVILVATEGNTQTPKTISEEDRKQPLSFSERRDLLRSLYNDDPLVEICSQHCYENAAASVIRFLEENGYNKKVVGVIGEVEGLEEFEGNDILSENLTSIDAPADLLSEDEVRKSVRLNDFSTWMEKYAPEKMTSEAKNKYKSVFERLERIHSVLDETNYRKEFKGLFWGV